MCNENGSQIFGCASDARKALADLARAEAGVHKYACLVGFKISAVAAGTAAENGEFDGHEQTLVLRRRWSNFFRCSWAISSANTATDFTLTVTSCPCG
jgi:hypothetical protein